VRFQVIQSLDEGFDFVKNGQKVVKRLIDEVTTKLRQDLNF
jgi:hypothetical protein